MKDYFSEIDFSEIEDEEKPKEDSNKIKANKKSWNEAKTEIIRMVNAIESGNSNISRPIQFIGTPFKDVMSRALENPNEKNIKDFLKIAGSDVNRRFRMECEKIIKSKIDLDLGETNE